VVDEAGETSSGYYQEFHAEGIVISVVGGFEFYVDQVTCSVSTNDVNALHDSVVKGNKIDEKIEVPSSEDQGEH